LQDAVPGEKPGVPPRRVRLGFSPTAGTAGQQVLGLDLFEELLGEIPLLDGLVQLARNMNVSHERGKG
jgi:hypothetical protein